MSEQILMSFNRVYKMTHAKDDKNAFLVVWLTPAVYEMMVETEQTKDLYNRYIIWLRQQGMVK
jgi:hypothetical protein